MVDFGLAKLPAVDFGKGGPARPFVGVKTLMLAHGSKNPDVAIDIMKYYTAEAQQSAIDSRIRQVAGSDPGGPATEIANAKQLLDSGAIDQGEYDRLKQRALAAA